jgi:hypothetical protein
MARAPSFRFRTAPALRIAGTSLLLALAGCTIPFTPGDAKPSVYTPFPSGAASSTGRPASESMRGGPSM